MKPCLIYFHTDRKFIFADKNKDPYKKSPYLHVLSLENSTNTSQMLYVVIGVQEKNFLKAATLFHYGLLLKSHQSFLGLHQEYWSQTMEPLPSILHNTGLVLAFRKALSTQLLLQPQATTVSHPVSTPSGQ